MVIWVFKVERKIIIVYYIKVKLKQSNKNEIMKLKQCTTKKKIIKHSVS